MNLKNLYKHLTRNWKAKPLPKEEAATQCHFGCFDTLTGKHHAGYMTRGGEMKFEKLGTEVAQWQAPEPIDKWNGNQSYIKSSLFGASTTGSFKTSGVIYKERHVFNNCSRYFIGSPNNRTYIEPKAYEKLHEIIEL